MQEISWQWKDGVEESRNPSVDDHTERGRYLKDRRDIQQTSTLFDSFLFYSALQVELPHVMIADESTNLVCTTRRWITTLNKEYIPF